MIATIGQQFPPVPASSQPVAAGTPETWPSTPLVRVNTPGSADDGIVAVAVDSRNPFRQHGFERVGTDLAAAVTHATERAGRSTFRGGGTAQGVLQAADGQFYVATLRGAGGASVTLPTSLDGPTVLRLHPAVQAVVDARTAIDLRGDRPAIVSPTPEAPTPRPTSDFDLLAPTPTAPEPWSAPWRGLRGVPVLPGPGGTPAEREWFDRIAGREPLF